MVSPKSFHAHDLHVPVIQAKATKFGWILNKGKHFRHWTQLHPWLCGPRTKVFETPNYCVKTITIQSRSTKFGKINLWGQACPWIHVVDHSLIVVASQSPTAQTFHTRYTLQLFDLVLKFGELTAHSQLVISVDGCTDSTIFKLLC